MQEVEATRTLHANNGRLPFSDYMLLYGQTVNLYKQLLRIILSLND